MLGRTEDKQKQVEEEVQEMERHVTEMENESLLSPEVDSCAGWKCVSAESQRKVIGPLWKNFDCPRHSLRPWENLLLETRSSL